MSEFHVLMSQELTRARAREIESELRRRALVRDAMAARNSRNGRGGRVERSTGLRVVAAAPLRTFGGWAATVASAACTAAARIEGRPA